MPRPRGMVLIAGLALLALILGLGLGATVISPTEVWLGLIRGSGDDGLIIRNIRAPRVLLAFLVGGALGLSGAGLQAVVRNPLADPYLLGLSGGAGLGAVMVMAWSPLAPWAVPLAAFLGALAAIALVYRLALVAGRRLDSRILLLAGVAVGAFAAAIMTAILTLSSAAQLRNAFLWLLGGFSAASWRATGIFAVYALLPIGVLVARARTLDLLALGEESAEYLGANVERGKREVLAAASLLTAASVAVCGMIGFVGLVVPHLTRRLVGSIHRALLPAVFLTGGTLLVVADVLARTVARPVELPVGVVTALVGVPVFAFLLRRSGRGGEEGGA